MYETDGEVEDDVICIVEAGGEVEIGDVGDVREDASDSPEEIHWTSSISAYEEKAGDDDVQSDHEDQRGGEIVQLFCHWPVWRCVGRSFE